MKLSIIIPTYKREKVLCETLKSLQENLLSVNIETEILVIDQTIEHNAETQNYLDRKVEEGFFTYIRIDSPSLPNARNVGIKKSSGDIVIFFDDDVLLKPDCLNNYLAVFKDEKVDSVVGKVTVVNRSAEGNILLSANSPLKSWIKRVLCMAFAKGKGYKITFWGTILNNLENGKRSEVEGGMGCSMAFRRRVFEKVGIFDTNYIGNALREESDMFVRIKKAGMRIMYEPEAALLHVMCNDGGCRTEQNADYWKRYFYNNSYFYIKNFHFSLLWIKCLLIFDYFACKKVGIDVDSLMKDAYAEAEMNIGKS